jgi:hypothetical protein
MLTEIGKPRSLGVEPGKFFPPQMAGCSSSNDWPLPSLDRKTSPFVFERAVVHGVVLDLVRGICEAQP